MSYTHFHLLDFILVILCLGLICSHMGKVLKVVVVVVVIVKVLVLAAAVVKIRTRTTYCSLFMSALVILRVFLSHVRVVSLCMSVCLCVSLCFMRVIDHRLID